MPAEPTPPKKRQGKHSPPHKRPRATKTPDATPDERKDSARIIKRLARKTARKNLSLPQAVDLFETLYTYDAVARAGGNFTRATEILEIERATLHRRARQRSGITKNRIHERDEN